MSKKVVLAIDDSPTILKILNEVLKRGGYDVVSTHDGLEGIHLAKKMKPDLIILDVILPKMNGLQVCQAIRKDYVLKDIPLILMSANEDIADEKFYDEGAIIDYLIKPFSPESLLTLIPNILKRREIQKESASAPVKSNTNMDAD